MDVVITDGHIVSIALPCNTAEKLKRRPFVDITSTDVYLIDLQLTLSRLSIVMKTIEF